MPRPCGQGMYSVAAGAKRVVLRSEKPSQHGPGGFLVTMRGWMWAVTSLGWLSDGLG